MPLSSIDLVWYYTGTASGPADNFESIGGTITPNKITSGQDENVFDDVTGAESEVGESHYRAIALKNTASAHDYLNYEAWITGYSRSGDVPDTIKFSLAIPSGSPSSIELLADEYTAPNTANFHSTCTWVVEGNPSNTIPVNNTWDLKHGDWLGIWFWRTIPAGASAYTNRSCTLKFRGETTGSPRMIIEKTWRVDFNTEGQISVQSL